MNTQQSLPTREEIISKLQADIELQKLYTEIQELRTRQVIAHLNEIKVMAAYEEMTKPTEQPTPEQIKEMTDLAEQNK